MVVSGGQLPTVNSSRKAAPPTSLAVRDGSFPGSAFYELVKVQEATALGFR